MFLELTSFLAFLAAVSYGQVAPFNKTQLEKPAYVVYAASRKGAMDLFAAPVRGSGTIRLTRDSLSETAPQCTSDGRTVVYVADGKVYSVSLSKGRKRKKTAKAAKAGKAGQGPLLLGELPKDLWTRHYTRIRHFVKTSPTGRWVAFPADQGIRLVETRTGKSSLIQPKACASASTSIAKPAIARARPADPKKASNTLRVVHPGFWMPGRDSLLYLSMESQDDRYVLLGRVYEAATGFQTACWPVMGQKKSSPLIEDVEALEVFFKQDGRAALVSFEARLKSKPRSKTQSRTSVFHRAFNLFPTSPIALPGNLRVDRFHGFRLHPAGIVFTGGKARNTRKLYTYFLEPVSRGKGRGKVHLTTLTALSPTWAVLGYFPLRRTALIATPAPSCAKTRLYKVIGDKALRKLVKWAQWSELLAADPFGSWGLFRSAVQCHHRRPVLYLMRMDGSLLTREMPARFSPLRTLHPGQVALCPRPSRQPS